MENAISGLIIIGVLVLAMLGLSEGALSAQTSLAEAIQHMQARLTEQSRTNLAGLSANLSGLGSTLYITIKNTGTTRLADFDDWDVIVAYTDTVLGGHVDWYPYGTWSRQIYLTAPTTLEVLEPNILNPGEEMVISVPLASTVGSPTINTATVTTPNGVSVTTVFLR